MFRRRALVVAIAALAVQLAVAPVSASPAGNAFAGTWQSIDTDGSSQLLIVSAGSKPSVVYQDFYASGCDRFGGPATHWVGAGTGSIDGDLLEVWFHKSGCGAFLMGGYGDAYLYDAGADTLTDTFGIVWSRAS
jgi:hypothetical protein